MSRQSDLRAEIAARYGLDPMDVRECNFTSIGFDSVGLEGQRVQFEIENYYTGRTIESGGQGLVDLENYLVVRQLDADDDYGPETELPVIQVRITRADLIAIATEFLMIARRPSGFPEDAPPKIPIGVTE